MPTPCQTGWGGGDTKNAFVICRTLCCHVEDQLFWNGFRHLFRLATRHHPRLIRVSENWLQASFFFFVDSLTNMASTRSISPFIHRYSGVDDGSQAEFRTTVLCAQSITVTAVRLGSQPSLFVKSPLMRFVMLKMTGRPQKWQNLLP